MNKFEVTTKRPYSILIGQELLHDAGQYISECITPCKACVVTDSTVNGLYAQVIMSSLIEHGFQASKIVFPSGEHSKNLSTYSNILEALADEGLSRSDIIIALGGGVVGDMSGFAAATYMRGIRYIQVPTTYLAAVDSSVGGKTGLDLLSGKNLAGAFWQPSLVICDYKTFGSLPGSELLDGVAEAVKSSMVAESTLIDHILENDYAYVIERCVSIKKSIVEADEQDTGMRQLLNFGHTVGHCIEKLSSYSISHGHAVAKGMVVEARAAFKMGLTENDTSVYLTDILNRCGFDLSVPYSSDDIYPYALNDKKINGDSISVVVPEFVGKCRLHKISLSDLKTYLAFGLNEK